MDDWNQLRIDVRAAMAEFVRGNPEPFKRLWSHSETVSMLGAFGGIELGWENVARRLDWGAAQYREGDYQEELISEYVGHDLACTVSLERIQAHLVGTNEIVERERRVTQVYRPEGGRWQIMHQHGDFLTQKGVS